MRFGSSLEFKDRFRERLDPDTRDFVFASIGGDLEAVKNLQRQWELHPGELGVYEELVHRRIAAKQGLAPGFPARWRRLDPENGMWLFLEAVGKNEEWKAKGPPAGETFSREVCDLLCQSAAAPRFESYLPELRKRRLGMLGATGMLSEEVEVILYSISALFAPTIRHQHDAVLTFGRAAQQAATDKDTARFTTLLKSWERLAGRLAANGNTMLDLVVPGVMWGESDKAMLQATRDLGLQEEEARVDEIRRKFADYRTAFPRGTSNSRPRSSLAEVLASPDGGADASVFEPGRRVEYAVMERMSGVVAAAVVLLFLVGASFESFRRGGRVNGLAAGLGPLFRPADFWWILALGVVVPALWYFGITRWTPLGLRDIGMTFYKPQPILIQEGAALVFALLIIVQTARWRVAVRGAFLALKPNRPWIGWTFAGIAAVVMLMPGGVLWLSGNEERYLQATAATGGLPLLWLLWEAGMVLFSPGNQALGGVLFCRRMVVPLAVMAALLLGGWAPLVATERHWHARDEVTRVDRERGGLTMMESRVMEALSERFHKAFPETGGIR
jgi:hypothetical protein